MGVSQEVETRIGLETVGYHRGPFLDGLLHEWQDASRGRVSDSGQSNPADTLSADLCGNGNQSFLANVSSTSSLLNSADERLIDFHLASEAISSGSNHGPTELVQPSPRSFITAKAQGALQAKGAGPELLAGHKPHD